MRPRGAASTVGNEDVGAQVDLLCGAFELPTDARAREARSMAGSMTTSTSASFGTGLSVESEPSRAIRRTPGDDRAARNSKHGLEQVGPGIRTEGERRRTMLHEANRSILCGVRTSDEVPGMSGDWNV